MDLTRDELTAQRAATSLKEAAVAKGGVGTDLEPHLGLVMVNDAGEPEPAVLFEIPSLPDDLFAACRTIVWTDAVAVLVVSDTYMTRDVDGLPRLEDTDGLKPSDLVRLFRARDPRVFEGVNVSSMDRDGKRYHHTSPYAYTSEGGVQWLDSEPDREPGELDTVVAKTIAAAFRLQSERPAEVAPLGALQAGFTAGLNTLLVEPEAFGAYPFRDRMQAMKDEAAGRVTRAGDVEVFSFTLPV